MVIEVVQAVTVFDFCQTVWIQRTLVFGFGLHTSRANTRRATVVALNRREVEPVSTTRTSGREMQASFPPARVNLRDGKKKAKRRPKVPTGEASTAPRGDAKPEAWKERDLDAWHDVEHQRSRRPREAHADSENDTEEDEDALGEDYESGNRSHASSRASSRSNFSTKSYPRAAPPSRRREHDRRAAAGTGYQSEDPSRWSSLGPNTSQRALRSSLRRDMRQEQPASAPRPRSSRASDAPSRAFRADPQPRLRQRGRQRRDAAHISVRA